MFCQTASKTLKGNQGEVTIDVPRDRDSTFVPQTLRKGQTRITGMDDQVLSLYAKGMSTRDISAVFRRCMALRFPLAWSQRSLTQ